jgi:predicted enzyme related to lactoylglutathione lyase
METGKRVTGIGGIFFTSRDPQKLATWYRDTLGIDVGEGGHAMFQWRDQDDPERIGSTIWSIFPNDTDYFKPGNAPYMLNYRVDDLDAVLAALRAAGGWVDDRIEEADYGRFGWALDPDGRRIELWQPLGESEAPPESPEGSPAE